MFRQASACWFSWPARYSQWLLALLPALLVSAAAYASPYGFDRLRDVFAVLDRGDRVQAQALLESTRASVSAVRADLMILREKTTSMAAACDDSLKQLERARGDAIAAHERLEEQLRTEHSSLKAAVSQEQSAQTEMGIVQESIARVQRAMREHAARLQELEKWWWVPGYGAYLGIRELVDNESGRLVSLRRDLSHAQDDARQSWQRAAAAEEMVRQLESAIIRSETEAAAAAAVQNELLSRIAAMRSLNDFLHDAALMADDLESVLELQVQTSLDRVASDLRRLIERAEASAAAPPVLRAQNIASLGDALGVLAEKASRDFLLSRLQREDCEADVGPPANPLAGAANHLTPPGSRQ
jgi:hypothetical protein